MIKFNEKALFTLMLLVFSGLIFYLTLDLSRLARLVPLRVLIVTLGLLAFQLLLDLVPRLARKYSRFEKVDIFRVERFLDKTRNSRTQSATGLSRTYRELRVFFWVLMMLVFILLFGFVIAVPLYTFLYLKWRAEESWLLSSMLTIGIWGLLYGVFVLALGVHLYEGKLWGWLGIFS